MRSAAPAMMDDELRGIVESLAEGMFPLGAWIQDKIAGGKYKPREHVPWREKGASLSVKATGAVEFFEELLEQSEADAPLIERFTEVIADPLRFSPLLEGAPDWRASRHLDAAAQFGIVASQNVIASADDKPKPVTRAQFYAPYWDLLRQAVGDAAPKSPAEWEALASDLMADRSAHWPAGQPFKSSLLMKQLGRDLLHGLLNMRNPAADPWRVALLEELGEHRRVGNSFTRDDAARFMQAFKEKMARP